VITTEPLPRSMGYIPIDFQGKIMKIIREEKAA